MTLSLRILGREICAITWARDDKVAPVPGQVNGSGLGGAFERRSAAVVGNGRQFGFLA